MIVLHPRQRRPCVRRSVGREPIPRRRPARTPPQGPADGGDGDHRRSLRHRSRRLPARPPALVVDRGRARRRGRRRGRRRDPLPDQDVRGDELRLPRPADQRCRRRRSPPSTPTPGLPSRIGTAESTYAEVAGQIGLGETVESPAQGRGCRRAATSRQVCHRPDQHRHHQRDRHQAGPRRGRRQRHRRRSSNSASPCTTTRRSTCSRRRSRATHGRSLSSRHAPPRPRDRSRHRRRRRTGRRQGHGRRALSGHHPSAASDSRPCSKTGAPTRSPCWSPGRRGPRGAHSAATPTTAQASSVKTNAASASSWAWS